MFLYLGLFFLSCATLVFEISLTRLLSVSLWSHFAFLVVSIAMFGFGFSGTFLSLFPQARKKNWWLAFSSFFFSLTLPISFIIANHLPFDLFRITWDRTQLLYLSAFYLTLSIPFFCTGVCLSTAFTQRAQKSGLVYASDLTGAAVGAVLPIVLFPIFGPKIVLFAALLGGVATVCFALNSAPKIKFLSCLWLLLLSLAILEIPLNIKISPYKTLSVVSAVPQSQILGTFWNSISRIDIVKSPIIKYAPGLSLKYKGALPSQLGITIDANNLSVITSSRNLDFVNFLPSSLAYHLGSGKKVLIINPGGGLDVTTALYFQKNVTVTEENPLIVSLLKDEFKNFSDNLYQRPEVKIEVENARSFLKKTWEKYDLIKLPLMGTITSASTGIYGLSENYLFTVEAFADYYSHLSENGLLTVDSWLTFPPKETPRLISLAIAALQGMGITDPQERIALIRTETTGTFLLKRGRITNEESLKIKDYCLQRGFNLVYLPGLKETEVNHFNKLDTHYVQMVSQLLGPERKRFVKIYLFDIRAVTDDRPYFFNFFKVSKVLDLYKSMGKKWEPFFEGGFISIFALFQALALSTVFILLPIFLKKLSKRERKWPILVYFASLGLGFMFIEIAAIYKFILFLGHPAWSFSAVLSSLLFFSGLGSFLSQRFSPKKLPQTLLTLGFLILGEVFVYPFVFNALLGRNLIIRVLTTIFLLAPLGLSLGIPFPLGMRLIGRLGGELVPWAFSVNACFSVIGSILAITLAQLFGFNLVMILAVLFYLTAWGANYFL